MSSTDLKDQIFKCLSSSEDFKNNFKPVHEELLKQNKTSTKNFMDTVLGIFSDPIAAPASKFYAMYLVKVVTETENPFLISEFFSNKEFITLLEKHAVFAKEKPLSERGVNLFSSKPQENEKAIAVRYVCLLLEMIKFWNIKYGANEKGKDNPVREFYRKLTEKQSVTFPEKYSFYKFQQQLGEDLSKHVQQISQQQSQTKPPEPSKEEDVNTKARKRMLEAKNLKDELVSLYEGNQREAEIEFLSYFYQNLTKVNKELMEARDYLMKNKTSANEAIIKEIAQGNEQMKSLEAEFQKFSKKTSNWDEHKTTALTILKENLVIKVDSAPVSQSVKNNWLIEEKKVGDNREVKKEPEEKLAVEVIDKEKKSELAVEKLVTEEKKEAIAKKKIEILVEEDKKVTRFDSSLSGEPQQRPSERNVEKKVHSLSSAAKRSASMQNQDQKLITSDTKPKAQEYDMTEAKLHDQKLMSSEIKPMDKKTTVITTTELKPKEQEFAITGTESNQQKLAVSQIKPIDQKPNMTTETKPNDQEPTVSEVKPVDLKPAATSETKLKNQEPITSGIKLNQQKASPISETKPNEQKPIINEIKPIDQKSTATSQIKSDEQKPNASEIKLIDQKSATIIESNSKDQKGTVDEIKQTGQKPTTIAESKPKDQVPKTAETKPNEQKPPATDTKPKNPRQLAASEIKSKEPTMTLTKSTAFETPIREPRRNIHTARDVVSSFKMDQASVADKFVSELKMMEQSIRTARERSSDMDRIKESIAQSFLRRSRDPPAYKELVDENVLKNLQGYLEKLKKEKQALSQTPEQHITTTTTPPPSQNSETKIKYINNLEPELIDKIANLRIQCEELKTSLELANQHNQELVTKLQQVQAEFDEQKKQEKQSTDRELEKLKQENRSLLERITKLENHLKEAETNSSKKIVNTSSQQEAKLQEVITKTREEKRVLEENVAQLKSQNEKLTKMLEEKKVLDETIAQLKTQNEELNGQISQLKTRRPSLEPQAQNPRMFHRPGRLIKNVPHTLRTDSSDEAITQMTWENNNQDLTNDSVSASVFGRAREVIVMNRQEVQFEDSNRRSQKYRFATQERIKLANITEGSKTNHRFEIRSQGMNDAIFGTPYRSNSSRTDTHHHSPVSKKTETFCEGDSFRSHYRPSDHSLGKRAKADIDERTFSPPGEELVEGRPQLHSPGDEKDVSVAEYVGEDWQRDGEQVLGDLHVFKELKARLHAASSLTQFKQSCLKAKGLFFENEAVQVGITTSVFRDLTSAKNQLQIMVYYSNKLSDSITEFKVSHLGGLNVSIVSKPDAVDQVIAPNRQTKQQFFVSFSAIPFGCPQLTCEGDFGGSHKKFFFYLPTIITKFMEFKYVETSEFRPQWNKWQKKVIRTEQISLDTALITTANDFKKYFGHLIDFSPESGNEMAQQRQQVRFGGLFELEKPGVQYLLHINVIQNKNAVFQIASQRKNHDHARYLLQTLIFIFGQ